MNELFKFIDNSKTAYHTAENAADYLTKNGFIKLEESDSWNIVPGQKYFVVRDGSAVVAFVCGSEDGFNIVASHGDSPCFKIKYNPEINVENYCKLSMERYGGAINYSFLDTPLTIAGRVAIDDGDKLVCKTFISKKNFVIPSVAIHFNRSVNDGIKLNPQTDMCLLEGLNCIGGLEKELKEFADGNKIADWDLYAVSDQKPFDCGYGGNLFCSPRIDNLTSVYASIVALSAAKPKATAVAYIANDEEVGSITKQGAGSTFLYSVLKEINGSLNGNMRAALADSFMVSCDNAHALHPNHPELSDPTNKTLLGGGIAIKHHAGQNYTTDALSSAVIKNIFDRAGARYQDFFMRSDLPCGGTLGTTSSTQVSVRSVDIGIPQLAMHSCIETACKVDYKELVKGLKEFYSCRIKDKASDGIVIE
ncbi:MAG: M18 family aminopeptidase [Clostridia bacterium]|nr:M18 family aminopeptidase [Clostridia bacterium]